MIFSPQDIAIISTLPIISPYNSDGSFRQFYKIIDGRNPDGSPRWITKKFFNELAEREQNDNGQKTFNFQGNINAQYTLNKHIYIASQLGIDYQGSNENIYSSMKNWSGYNIGRETGRICALVKFKFYQLVMDKSFKF